MNTSREILFKAKRLSDGKWVEGYYIYHIKRTICPMGDSVKPEDVLHVIIHDGFSDWNMPRDMVWHEINPETLCQYTGLTDKNGNKIWENDVVEEDFGNHRGAVVFGEFESNVLNNLGFSVDWSKSGVWYRQDLPYWADKITVVGTIFDDPELLKEEVAE